MTSPNQLIYMNYCSQNCIKYCKFSINTKMLFQTAKGALHTMKTSLTEKIADFTELPKELITGMAKLTVIGNHNIQVDGCKGLSEYSAVLIRLRVKNGAIEISGSELCITRIEADSVFIEGIISDITFIQKNKNIKK